MREIKFRAWDRGRNIMIGSDYPKNWGDNSDQWYFDLARMQLTGIENISKDANHIVMQYTGLKDKQGVKIYEGDIVKDLRSLFKDARSYSKVFYQEDRGRFVFGGWEIPAGMSHTFEVIGNIYENTELLKESK